MNIFEDCTLLDDYSVEDFECDYDSWLDSMIDGDYYEDAEL